MPHILRDSRADVKRKITAEAEPYRTENRYGTQRKYLAERFQIGYKLGFSRAFLRETAAIGHCADRFAGLVGKANFPIKWNGGAIDK